MRGGDAARASRSVNARLSSTASAARVTLRRRLSASDRAHAARSDATFFDIVSSGLASDVTSPAETGWAAPMWVPGAIAATSAASTRMNPADAARAPEGPTRTAMGVRAAIMRLTMVCVESTSPPGVRSVKTSSEARSASARSMADTMNSAVTGWMMPSTSAA